MSQDAPSSDAPSARTVGVPVENFPGERRVAIVPANVAALKKAGIDVIIQSGAGDEAGYPDADFQASGAEVVADRDDVFSRSDIVLQVRTAGANLDTGVEDRLRLRNGQTLIGMCDPLAGAEVMQEIAKRGVTSFAMELLPRITRAQSMDVLSSQASIAGYKAVLAGAAQLPRMCPMMMTAAGTIAPARFFVLGAGVAGLQAIATAKRLGAVVWSYDVRPAVKDEVLSLGARFLEIDLVKTEDKQSGGYAKEMDEEFYRRQREAMMKVIGESDVVITTAAIPGRKAPVLVTEEMVEAMPPGSIIIDLAAETGGNCALTKAREVITEHGVTIDGTINIPATVPYHSSQMYGKNVTTFLLHLVKEGALDGAAGDEIVQDTMVTRDGEVVNARVREVLGLEAIVEKSNEADPDESVASDDAATSDATTQTATAEAGTAESETAVTSEPGGVSETADDDDSGS